MSSSKWLFAFLAVDLILGVVLGWLLSNARYRAYARRWKARLARWIRGLPNTDRCQQLLDGLSDDVARHSGEVGRFEKSLAESMRSAEPADDSLCEQLQRVHRANDELEGQLDRKGDRLWKLYGRNETPLGRVPEVLSDLHRQVHGFGRMIRPIEDVQEIVSVAEMLLDAMGDLLQTEQRLETELSAARERIVEQQSRLTAVEREARRDALTGLPNRRAFEEKFAQLQSIHEQRGQAYALALIDIDHFKRFNDGYGHTAGDAVLRVIGRVLMDAARPCDHIFRFGGEEFAVLMTDCTLEQARPMADHFRSKIEKTAILFEGHELIVTVSAGVAAIIEGESAQGLLVRTDAALYDAKCAGRNQTRTRHGNSAPAPESNMVAMGSHAL